MRRRRLECLLLWSVAVTTASNSDLFTAPTSFDAASVSTWREKLLAWRAAIVAEIGYNGSIYDEPALAWSRLAYVQPQVHLYDRALYSNGSYTVETFLDGLEHRYGGIDAVLLWPTYTNIGIDDRNQFDYFRALPGGGLDAMADVTQRFHARGVKVLWAYNPWDEGTRYEGEPDATAMAALLATTGGDGFNGDTMGSVGEEFYAASVAAGRPAVLEPEGGGYGDWAAANWETMGWGYWWASTAPDDNFTTSYDVAPGVDKLKWLDSSTSQMSMCVCVCVYIYTYQPSLSSNSSFARSTDRNNQPTNQPNL